MWLWAALGIAWCALFVAYAIAGQIWVERHSLHFRIGSSPVRCSGAFGEVILSLFAAGLVWAIDRACSDVSLDQLIRSYPAYAGFCAAGVGAIVYVHGVGTALTAPKERRMRLLWTYLVYGVYSTIVFTGGVGMSFVLVKQFLYDASVFQHEAQRIGDMVATLGAGSAETLPRGLELSNLDALFLLDRVEASMSPVFVLAAGIFAINIAVRLTPLRGVFINNAVLITLVSTAIGVLAVIVAGGWTYVAYYSTFIESYLAHLATIRAQAAQMPADGLERYVEIVRNTTEQKSLVGFITRMSNEWGGLAAILGGAQWAAQQFARPEAKESPAGAAT